MAKKMSSSGKAGKSASGTSGKASAPANAKPEVLPFDIDWNFDEAFSPRQKALFEEAEKRWQYVIRGWPVQKDGKAIGPQKSLKINAQLRPIDGFNNVVAWVDPDKLVFPPGMKSADSLPCEGTIEVDEWDLEVLDEKGLLLDTITHEIGHVLGFGTIWKARDLLEVNNNELVFVGKNARKEYGKLLDPLAGENAPAADVPVEGSGGVDTRAVHWEQKQFADELMSGNVSVLVGKLTSKLTVASLRDLGYCVNLDATEPYTLARPEDPLKSATIATPFPSKVSCCG